MSSDVNECKPLPRGSSRSPSKPHSRRRRESNYRDDDDVNDDDEEGEAEEEEDNEDDDGEDDGDGGGGGGGGRRGGGGGGGKSRRLGEGHMGTRATIELMQRHAQSTSALIYNQAGSYTCPLLGST